MYQENLSGLGRGFKKLKKFHRRAALGPLGTRSGRRIAKGPIATRRGLRFAKLSTTPFRFGNVGTLPNATAGNTGVNLGELSGKKKKPSKWKKIRKKLRKVVGTVALTAAAVYTGGAAVAAAKKLAAQKAAKAYAMKRTKAIAKQKAKKARMRKAAPVPAAVAVPEIPEALPEQFQYPPAAMQPFPEEPVAKPVARAMARPAQEPGIFQRAVEAFIPAAQAAEEPLPYPGRVPPSVSPMEQEQAPGIPEVPRKGLPTWVYPAILAAGGLFLFTLRKK